MYSLTTALPQPPPPPETCSQGHRTTLILSTSEGGSICLLCLSNLISNSKSSTVHVSYALSQLSQAITQPHFLQCLLTFHSHFLTSPLVAVLSNFDDEPIAKQTIDLIVKFCDASHNNGNEDVCKEFVSRISDSIALGSLAWSHRQLYMLHCFGVLLDNQEYNLYACIRHKDTLILNLITGLQLSIEEVQGEIMFVLYKFSLLQYTYMDDGCCDVLLANCPKLLLLSVDVLMKSQCDDVRLNCVAFLMVLAQRGFFQSACIHHVGSTEADNFMQIREHMTDVTRLEELFAEAVKAPLLSSDIQVQIATLDLIKLYLSSEDLSGKAVHVFIKENIADYVYEILRLSGCEDQVVNSSIQVLDVLSTSEEAFRQKLAIGLTTLIPVMKYVSGVPFHPVQYQALKLILKCLSNCPGIVSTSNVEDISIILAEMFKKHTGGETGMPPETFILSCSIFVALMKCSSSHGSSILATSIRDASKSSFSTSLGNNQTRADQILHYLYLLKEAYAYDNEDDHPSTSKMELRVCIVEICKLQVLPWFMKVINEIEEEAIALGVIETFHAILLQDSNIETNNFADSLVSSSWFSVLFGCLGLFPSEKMKWRVYLIFSSIVDVLLGSDSGQPIRDTAYQLPSDPTDLLFLLGQKSSHNVELLACQSAVLLILYLSSLYNDRIADDKLVLASLEQFIQLNSCDFHFNASASVTIELLVNLYSLYRGFAKMSYQIPYSAEAERILFHILAEKDWDSLSTRIHLTSLKWLFQQEKICRPLSEQILKFCKCYTSTDNIVVHHETSHKADANVFAELIASGDNFVPLIFVYLLSDLVENDSQDHDIISVVKVLKKIIEIAPVASDQFCMHGIDVVIQNICNHSPYSFPELFVATSQLLLSILRSVHSESISNNEAWEGLTMKLMDYMVPAVTSDGWTEEVLMTIAILSLILHHSTKQTLIEASKTILLSTHLISAVNNTISEACSKGPALFDHDEETRTGEVLIFLLLLLFFSMRSARAVLPGIIDFQILLDEDSKMQPLSYVSIHCHDLAKLMHFGSPPIKLVASFCLVELFTGISDYISSEQGDLKFREGYLQSMSAVLEGLIFSSDIIVSMNCSRCLSMLMTWEELKTESKLSEKNNWCRLIVEELVMSLSTPSLTSNLFSIHHKPAANVAVALLRLSKVPPWVAKLFDDCSISSIIQNISSTNISIELVLLFHELLKSGYLNSTQIANLNRAFQACRRHIYADEIHDINIEENTENAALDLDHIGKARAFLFNLLPSKQLYLEVGMQRSQSWKKDLLEEMESFTKCLMEEDEIER